VREAPAVIYDDVREECNGVAHIFSQG